jgi:hypothetical protein
VLSQVQFRLPFACEYIKDLEDTEFNGFVKSRYANQLGVYSYSEGAVSRYAICHDSTTFLHLFYARLFKDFLINRNSIPQAKRLITLSKNHSEMLSLAYSEFLYQCLYRGNYTTVDSTMREIPWERFSKNQQSILARRIYFSMKELAIEKTPVDDIMTRILPTDTLTKLYTHQININNLGRFVDSLYKTGNIIEANMFCHQAYKQQIKETKNHDALAKQFAFLRSYLFDLGFKVNIYAIEVILQDYGMRGRLNNESDYYEDLLKYALRNKRVAPLPKYEFKLSWWETTILSVSSLLLLISLTVLIYSKITHRKLMKEYKTVAMTKFFAAHIRICMLEDKLNRLNQSKAV